MPPKPTSAATKQAKILTWFHASLTAHTLKDLEKAIPSVAGVHAMAVKDLIQALVDENLLRVEKIGSGNWYWAFAAAAKRDKEGVLRGAEGEVGRIEGAIEEAERALEEERERMMGEGEDEEERLAAVEARVALLGEVEALEGLLAGYADGDPVEMARLERETAGLESAARAWRDNVECLECFLVALAGREKAAEIMEVSCGIVYVKGEGLREL